MRLVDTTTTTGLIVIIIIKYLLLRLDIDLLSHAHVTSALCMLCIVLSLWSGNAVIVLPSSSEALSTNRPQSSQRYNQQAHGRCARECAVNLLSIRS